MIALRIEDIKQFTTRLFVGETFDHFLVKEASVVTFNTFTIDGSIRPGYYSEEEMEEGGIGRYSSWGLIKPFCFSLIRGKKLPESFKIVLLLPPEGTKQFLSSRPIAFLPEQVRGLYLNIRYEEKRLTCVSGTSLSFFTLDKTLEEEWDQALKGFLKENQLAFSEE